MYQIQIFVSEVGEWYGWHCELQESMRDAKKQERIAKRYGWKTRVVKVSEDDDATDS